MRIPRLRLIAPRKNRKWDRPAAADLDIEAINPANPNLGITDAYLDAGGDVVGDPLFMDFIVELVEQAVEFDIRDLRIVQHVIAMVVVRNGITELTVPIPVSRADAQCRLRATRILRRCSMIDSRI